MILFCILHFDHNLWENFVSITHTRAFQVMYRRQRFLVACVVALLPILFPFFSLSSSLLLCFNILYSTFISLKSSHIILPMMNVVFRYIWPSFQFFARVPLLHNNTFFVILIGVCTKSDFENSFLSNRFSVFDANPDTTTYGISGTNFINKSTSTSVSQSIHLPMTCTNYFYSLPWI